MGIAARVSTAIFLAVMMIIIAASISISGQAQAAGVNPMCVGGWFTTCPCGTVPSKNGCIQGDNKFMCPCFETSNGFTTTGVCMAPGECRAQNAPGMGGGNALDAGLGQLTQILGQLMQQLMQGGGGGGGGDSGSGTSGGTGCASYYQTSQPSSDPCAYYVPSASTNYTSDLLNGAFGTTPADTSLTSSLFGSNTNTNTNTTNTNTNTTSNTSNSTAIANGVNAAVSNVVTQDLKPGSNAGDAQTAFGAAPGVSGDVQVLSGNRITMLASNRDINANKQTSGFYGYSVSSNDSTATIFTSICSARPWVGSFIASITPVSYFDNLCTSHGYSITPKQLIVEVPVVTTKAASTTVAPPPPQYLGPMKADIWASPTSVSLGSRASVFWNAKGVLTCKVTGSDNSSLGTTLSGTASTQQLTKNTTYSIACQSATSTISNQVVVTVQ